MIIILMKPISSSRRCSRGFTLVELLIVIVIIAVVAALSTAGYMKAKKSAKAAVSVSNLRGIGQTMVAWSTDHGGAFPSIRGFDSSEGESSDFRYWHWKLYDETYNNGGQYVQDKQWKDSVFYNPLMNSALIANWTCGYAMNARLIEKIYQVGFDKAISTPLKIIAVDDLARSPIIAPRRDHQYRTASELLYEENGKTPILFCDGHVTSMSRKEYQAGKYE